MSDQRPGPDTSSAAADATPAEARLWQWLEEAVDQSRRARRDAAGFDRLDEWLRLFAGEHYPHDTPQHKPPIVINELRSLILAEASDLADAVPRVYITRDARRGGRDEDLERAFRAVWVRQALDLKLAEAVVWALVAGTGFLRVGWDPSAADGLGDVVVDVVDPRSVYPDPAATSDLDWTWVVTETFMSYPELARAFPSKVWRLPPPSGTAGPGGSRDERPGPVGGLPYTGPLSNSPSLMVSPAQAAPRWRVLDAYMVDDTLELEAIEPTDPESGAKLLDEAERPMIHTRWVMKYPNGRRVVGVEGVILYDGPNTLPSARSVPPDWGLVRVVLEPTLGSFWGLGFPRQTGQLQLSANKLSSLVVENAIRLNNGLVVATGNTGIDWESFAGLPGQIVQINPGSQLNVVYPNPMPPDMIQAPIQALDMQRRILGFPPARVGGPAGASPELSELEISQGQGVTRLRARALTRVVQRLAELIFARLAYGYAVPREIPAVEGERFVPTVWEPLENPERYSVYVDPASFQVLSKTMVRRLAVALYRMNAIDRRALLEHIGWPEWEEVARRLDEAERAAAAAKLQARAMRGRGRAS